MTNLGVRQRKTVEWFPEGWPEDKNYHGTDIEHGTVRAYGLHRRQGQVACAPCRQAWNAYQREHRSLREQNYQRIIREETEKAGLSMTVEPTPRAKVPRRAKATKVPNPRKNNTLRIYQLALRRLAAEHPAEFDFYREEISEELSKE